MLFDDLIFIKHTENWKLCFCNSDGSRSDHKDQIRHQDRLLFPGLRLQSVSHILTMEKISGWCFLRRFSDVPHVPTVAAEHLGVYRKEFPLMDQLF